MGLFLRFQSGARLFDLLRLFLLGETDLFDLRVYLLCFARKFLQFSFGLRALGFKLCIPLRFRAYACLEFCFELLISFCSASALGFGNALC